MANLTLRGLLFKTEMDRHVFLVKVSVDRSPRARSISDLVKLTKIPDKHQTETSRQEHHSERNKRFAQKSEKYGTLDPKGIGNSVPKG